MQLGDQSQHLITIFWRLARGSLQGPDRRHAADAVFAAQRSKSHASMDADAALVASVNDGSLMQHGGRLARSAAGLGAVGSSRLA